MKITKDIITSAQKDNPSNEGSNIVNSGAIKNIQIFGNDIDIDVELKSNI